MKIYIFILYCLFNNNRIIFSLKHKQNKLKTMIKDKISSKTLLKVMEELENFESETFTAKDISLYQSVLKPTGAVYTKLKKVTLN